MVVVDHEDGFVIRDDQAVKAKLAAQQVGQDGGRGRHQLPIQFGIGVHDGMQAGIPDGGLEGASIGIHQFTPAHVDRGAIHAALRQAVTDEMLAGGHHTALFQALPCRPRT